MSVIPISSQLYTVLKALASSRRMVFITGLPGVGKSLLIQQLALIATEAGRKVHLLQYNVAREPFESGENITKYPEIESFTDPAIRKAVGLWARDAVNRWHEQHPEPEHLLIGELPLIGNRLIELAEVHEDAVEPLLSSDQAQFVVPVPSWEVREVIKETRARTIAEPQHEREKLDAPPNVLKALWEEVNGLAREINLTKASPKTEYNPYIYGGVYKALLHNRHSQILLIDQVLRPEHSVYEMDVVVSQLQATAVEAKQYMQLVESRYTPEELLQVVANWHAIITDEPKEVDPGPELYVPLPAALPGVVEKTSLTEDQLAALHGFTKLPFDTPPQDLVPALDHALEVLAKEINHDPVKADVHKFDVYDSYFNVTRANENCGLVFIAGLLQSYRNVMDDMLVPPHTLTVVELPMLRIALETTLHRFGV